MSDLGLIKKTILVCSAAWPCTHNTCTQYTLWPPFTEQLTHDTGMSGRLTGSTIWVAHLTVCVYRRGCYTLHTTHSLSLILSLPSVVVSQTDQRSHLAPRSHAYGNQLAITWETKDVHDRDFTNHLRGRLRDRQNIPNAQTCLRSRSIFGLFCLSLFRTNMY